MCEALTHINKCSQMRNIFYGLHFQSLALIKHLLLLSNILIYGKNLITTSKVTE